MTHYDAATIRGPVETRLGLLLSLVVTAIMGVWTASGDSTAKYSLYALPGLTMLACAMAMRWRVAIDVRSFHAVLIYAGLALIVILYNGYGQLATRDIMIVGSYLLMLAISVRVPPFVADACLASLALCTVLVALNAGIVLDVDFLTSGGILESTLAFPLGIVFLYFTSTRQWGRAAIAFVLFFLAFKRIAFAGVALVLALEFALAMVGRRRIGRPIAVLVVVTLSIFALFLLQIFDYVSVLLNNEQMSASYLSLGRSEFAEAIWTQMRNSGVGHLLLGFGPAAADQLLTGNFVETNPHNDWLKIAFDYGAVGFIAFHAVLYLIHPNTPLGNRLYIYLAVVMMTDNVLIYVFYFVYLFLFLRNSGLEDRRSVAAPRHPLGPQRWELGQ
jgi:hypothetical protein